MRLMLLRPVRLRGSGRVVPGWRVRCGTVRGCQHISLTVQRSGWRHLRCFPAAGSVLSAGSRPGRMSSCGSLVEVSSTRCGLMLCCCRRFAGTWTAPGSCRPGRSWYGHCASAGWDVARSVRCGVVCVLPEGSSVGGGLVVSSDVMCASSFHVREVTGGQGPSDPFDLVGGYVEFAVAYLAFDELGADM